MHAAGLVFVTCTPPPTMALQAGCVGYWPPNGLAFWFMPEPSTDGPLACLARRSPAERAMCAAHWEAVRAVLAAAKEEADLAGDILSDPNTLKTLESLIGVAAGCPHVVGPAFTEVVELLLVRG